MQKPGSWLCAATVWEHARIVKHLIYINLTNGLEVLHQYPDARFIRIQSSHCEAKAYNDLFMTLDADLLFNLALGNHCHIIDGGRVREPKALRVGLPIVWYILRRVWFNEKMPAPWPAGDDYYDRVYRGLDKKVKARLRYFKKFLLTDRTDIQLSWSWVKTTRDGDYEYWQWKGYGG